MKVRKMYIRICQIISSNDNVIGHTWKIVQMTCVRQYKKIVSALIRGTDARMHTYNYVIRQSSFLFFFKDIKGTKLQ